MNDIENDLFAKHSWYFRNALVRANYQHVQQGIKRHSESLELFFRNLLMGEKNELKNQQLIIGADDTSQSVTSNSSKAQIDTLSCTLEEKALLSCIRENPHIKQQEISEQIGRSISTG